MRTPMNDLLDFDLPIFAFSHCRDVVAAVTNAGGVGVLGAVAHTAEDLEVDMKWVEGEIATGATYGIDLLMPRKFTGAQQGGLSRADLRAQIRLSTARSWTNCLPATRSRRCPRCRRSSGSNAPGRRSTRRA